jgi:hypothetical protein
VFCALTLTLTVVGCNAVGASDWKASAVAARADEASTEQLPYFADRVITFDEYRTAVAAAVSCVRMQGFNTRQTLAIDGYYRYEGVAADGATEALDLCRAQWSQVVEVAYQESTGPSPHEWPVVEAVIACLRDAGEPPTLGYRIEQLRAHIEGLPPSSSASDCRRFLPTD